MMDILPLWLIFLLGYRARDFSPLRGAHEYVAFESGEF